CLRHCRVAFAHLGQKQRIAHLALGGCGKTHEVAFGGCAPDEGPWLFSALHHSGRLCEFSHNASRPPTAGRFWLRRHRMDGEARPFAMRVFEWPRNWLISDIGIPSAAILHWCLALRGPSDEL